jgi:hypothetical protein
MSFFKVSAPPAGTTKPSNNFTFTSDSDNDDPTPKPERAPSPPRGNLFSHSSSFLAVQAERLAREKKRKEKEERKKRERSDERKERKSGKKKQKDDERIEEGSVKVEKSKGDLKRRRISAKDGEDLLKKALAGTQVVELDSDEEEEDSSAGLTVQEQNGAAPVRRSPRRPKAGGQYATGPVSRPTFPLLQNDNDGDDDEDLQITATRTTRRPSPPPSEEDSDPEIAELSRKARAAAAERRRIAEEAQKTTTNTTSSSTPIPTLSTDTITTSTQPPLSSAPLSDPIISILITSPMPTTEAMIIRRKISQTLGAVREAYCRRWNLPQPEKVFLTFCGRRLYDSTKCLRLGLVVEEGTGKVRWEKGRRPGTSSAFEDGKDGEEEEVKVHVEAVDEEWFKRIREERERERRERFAQAGGGGEVEDVMGGENPEAEGESQKEEQKEKTWRLLVKAKGKKDFKVRVTAVSFCIPFPIFTLPPSTFPWVGIRASKTHPTNPVCE